MIDKNNFDINCFLSAPVAGKESWQGYDVERRDHLMSAMTKISLPGDILEFGVFQGKTITMMAEFLSDRKIWGFDSFEGLPEDWHMIESAENIKFPKGTFTVKSLPEVPSNVTLVKGWFEHTIPTWKQQNTASISLLHVDCDLYSSTREVLTQLNAQIISGTVIVFDDMYLWNNPKKYQLWHQGEYRALREWVSDHDRKFEVLSRNNYMQCAIKVIQ
jgi:predicted O-methyltransferase YrrM